MFLQKCHGHETNVVDGVEALPRSEVGRTQWFASASSICAQTKEDLFGCNVDILIYFFGRSLANARRERKTYT